MNQHVCPHCGNRAKHFHTAHQHSLTCGKKARASKRTRDPRQWADDGQGGLYRVFKRYGADLDMRIVPMDGEGYEIVVSDGVRRETVRRHNILAAQRVAMSLGMAWEG